MTFPSYVFTFGYLAGDISRSVKLKASRLASLLVSTVIQDPAITVPGLPLDDMPEVTDITHSEANLKSLRVN